jgi:regulatory protein
MKITHIKAQVRMQGRYSIFVDSKYEFSLSDTALLGMGLRIGQEVDRTKIEELKQAAGNDKLYGLVLRYVMIRPRSEWEVRSYLQRKKSPAPLTDQILNKLSDNNFISDVSFARSWVESRRLLRPTSKRKLQQELRLKRVSEEVIKQVLAEDGADEGALLRELVAKKRTQSRYMDDLKLMQYLARQGYRYEDIKAAMAR